MPCYIYSIGPECWNPQEQFRQQSVNTGNHPHGYTMLSVYQSEFLQPWKPEV